MSRRVVVLPEAEWELADALDWYDAQNPGLGDQFLDLFVIALQRVAESPYQYQIVRGRYRRALLGKFPYGLIYSVSESEIVIHSCFHGRRDP